MSDSPAGRELDARVAVEVMGWKPPKRRTVGATWYAPEGYGASENSWPSYSTDIAAAWLVVEKMRKRGFIVVLECLHDPQWFVGFSRVPRINDEFHALEESAALAICVAALKACRALPGGGEPT